MISGAHVVVYSRNAEADLERIFAAPDTRPLSASDLSAENRRHDEKLANSPWFRLWQGYGIRAFFRDILGFKPGGCGSWLVDLPSAADRSRISSF